MLIGSAPKLAVFAFVMRILVDGLQPLVMHWSGMLAILAVLSMAIGNITAIAQTNLKLQTKLDQENITITFELLHFLKNWLMQHINESDQRFGKHFKTASLQQYSTWSKEVEATMQKKKWWWKFW